jgi:hypothetical protein
VIRAGGFIRQGATDAEILGRRGRGCARIGGGAGRRGRSGRAVFKTTYTFECSEGKKVLSAGGKVNDAPDGNVGLTMIRPDGPLTIGRAGARVGHVVYNGSWSVDSFAVCAFPPPGLLNTDAIGNGAEIFGTCPAGRTVIGVGGEGGLIDLGQFYLSGLAVTGTGSWVRMTGFTTRWGTLAQLTCSS